MDSRVGLRIIFHLGVMALFLPQVYPQAISPKYEILGKYEVAAPDAVSQNLTQVLVRGRLADNHTVFTTRKSDGMRLILQQRFVYIIILVYIVAVKNVFSASPECGAFYVKENLCNLVSKDNDGAHSNSTSLTPSTVEYFVKKI